MPATLPYKLAAFHILGILVVSRLAALGPKDVVRGYRIHLQADGQELAPWYEIVTE